MSERSEFKCFRTFDTFTLQKVEDNLPKKVNCMGEKEAQIM